MEYYYLKITNRNGAPQPLVDAVMNDPYTKGDSDFSVTELIDSPRITALKKKYADKIIVDVSERRHSLYGQIVHGILDRADKLNPKEGVISSKRFFMNIPIKGKKYTVSGEIDRYEDGIIQDWKFVGTYKFKKEKGVPVEYQQQLNILYLLMRENGYKITGLQSIPLYKDWTERDSKEPVTDNWFKVLNVELKELSFIKSYVEERVRIHLGAQTKLPLCSSQETWYGNRCAKFCDVASFCSQYKNQTKEKK